MEKNDFKWLWKTLFWLYTPSGIYPEDQINHKEILKYIQQTDY